MFSSRKILKLVLQAMLCMTVFALSVAHSVDIRDPMQPPAFALKQFKLAKIKARADGGVKKTTVKKPSAKPLQLRSILISQTRKVAIINDRMLVVGDEIDKAKVVKILNDRVELIRKGKRIKLVLDNQLISIRKSPVKSDL